MSPDETPMAEHERPKKVVPKKRKREPEQDVPLTKEEFVAQMKQLTERARAAGLSPLQTLVETYAGRGRAILAGVLSALENADEKPKRKRRK